MNYYIAEYFLEFFDPKISNFGLMVYELKVFKVLMGGVE